MREYAAETFKKRTDPGLEEPVKKLRVWTNIGVCLIRRSHVIWVDGKSGSRRLIPGRPHENKPLEASAKVAERLLEDSRTNLASLSRADQQPLKAAERCFQILCQGSAKRLPMLAGKSWNASFFCWMQSKETKQQNTPQQN